MKTSEKIQEIREICEKDNYTLLQYNNSKDVWIQDSDGYKYKTSVFALSRHRGHNILQSNPFALDNIKLYVKRQSQGLCSVVADVYVDSNTPMLCMCKRHNQEAFLKTAQQLIHCKTICDKCRGEKAAQRWRMPENVIKTHVEERNSIYDHVERVNGKTIVYYICEHHKDKGVQHCALSHLYDSKHLCKYCARRGRTTKDFVKEVANIHPEISVLGEYEGCEARILCRCNKCGTQWSPPAKQLLGQRKRGCPTCGRQKIIAARKKTTEQFRKELSIINPDIEVVGEYTNTHTLIKCKCKIHNHGFAAKPCNLLNRTATCPVCSKKISRMEKRVGDILKIFNINNIWHHKFDDCRGDVFPLEYDYYLTDHNVVIEYDGEQHYKPVKCFGGKEGFERRKRYDAIKNQYCRDHGITIIRVPFYVNAQIDDYLISQLKNHGIIALTP